MFFDDKTTISELKEKLKAFDKERDWEQFHTPKEVMLALTIEVAEILEHFRFKTEAQVQEYVKDPKNKQILSHEVADCISGILLFANACNIDVSKAFEEKLAIKAKKYPVEKFRGSGAKYDALDK